MKFTFENITRNIKFQLFILLTALLFIFRLFFSPIDTFFLKLINELLVVFLGIFYILYLDAFFKSKKINPLSLVMNVGILNALIFFLIAFSGSILAGMFDDITDKIAEPGLIFNLISFFYMFIILSSVSYIFLTFKELFFLKHRKSSNLYFNTMVVFFILACFSTVLRDNKDLSFIWNAFMIISISLIVMNSLKISWIAFIVKKEKISLLILSVVITVLFIVNLVNIGGESVHEIMMAGFSTSLNRFLFIIMIYGVIYFSILFFTTLFHIPTAEAFDRKAQEVSSLQYFSKLITEVLDFKDLSETITDLAVRITEAEGAWIAWKEDKEMKIIANKNIDYSDAGAVTGFLLDNNSLEDYSSSEVFDFRKFRNIKLKEQYKSGMISSLGTHDKIRGSLIVVRKTEINFDEEDKDAINTFTDYASVAIENSYLLKESIEKERLEKELDVARDIQRKILPAHNPEYENLAISSVFIPAFEVGGDYYDFFEISKNKLGFVIADVSGKGISAAFIMAEIKGIFESLSRSGGSPRDVLIKANQILKRTLDRKTFVSAAYGIIDTEKEKLHISRAGHCPILLIRENKALNVLPTGMGLGLTFTSHFEKTLEEREIDLTGNDMIVLYTDGITEAKDNNMEDFGSKNFENVLIRNTDKTADEITNRVIQAVTLFSQNNSQHDDITLVILKWKQKININGEPEWQNSVPQLKT